jgi:macrolide transport system ATP-binding/permease protein
MGLRDWLFRRRQDEDLEDEIRAHLSMAARDRLDALPTPTSDEERAARLAALKEFGNVTLTREAARHAWGGRWREWVIDLGQDVRYACRVLGRSPGYALVVIVVLALGIGANVAVFSLFKGVALRPLPGVTDSGTLGVLVARTGAGRITPLSHPDFRDLRDQATLFAGLAGTTQDSFAVGLETGGQRVLGEMVTGNYFQVLGVRAHLGRTLLPSDDVAPGKHPVVVVSDAMWKRLLGADPAIVGKTILINRHPLTVVGVTEPDFRGSVVGVLTHVFIPVMMQPQIQRDVLGQRQISAIWGLGRLAGGASIDEAASQIDVLWTRLATAFPDRPIEQRATVIPMWQSPFGSQTYMLPAVLMMSAMGGLLLLIVCANVANLVLVRGLTRRGEIAARLALGASRRRILRLLFVESAVLAAPGGIAGLLLARTLLPLVFANSPTTASVGIPETYVDVSTDGLVVGFALLVSGGTALLFGFAPALRSTHVDLASVMKDDLSPRGGSRGRLRSILVVSQVAVSLLLLVTTGLVIRSLDAARTADIGFSQEGVGFLSMHRVDNRDSEIERTFYRSVLDAVSLEPGIDSVSLSHRRLLTLVDGRSRPVAIEGYVPREDEDTTFLIDAIAPSYFHTLRIPLLAGRDFERRDSSTADPIAIVNETLARRFWSGADAALGKRLRLSNTEWRTIVGVARDVKYARVTEDPRPHVYLPFEQYLTPDLTLLVRSASLSPALIEKVRARVLAIDPAVPIVASGLLRDQTRLSLSIYEMASTVLMAFGAVAVLLTSLGTYGLVSYAARQSTHEIGIRIAIGANRTHVIRRFLQRGLLLGGFGALFGFALSLALTRLLAGILYGVSATDAMSFTVAFAAVLISVFAASLVPAWRASRIDPIAALRHR